MKISNNPNDDKNKTFTEMFRLQSEFQARLADETLRYLRRLQGSTAPASPGTVVIPDGPSELTASAEPGGVAIVDLEVENLQRVYCSVSPSLSPLVSAAGITWFPETESRPASLLIGPDSTAMLQVHVSVPSQLPGGLYRGCVMLHGFRDGALPLVMDVNRVNDTKTKAEPNRRSAQRKKRNRKRRKP